MKLNQDRNSQEAGLLTSLESQLGGLWASYREIDSLKRQILAEVGSSSERVAGQVLDLLAWVQFQDMVRQQAELVMKAVEEIDGHRVKEMKEAGAYNVAQDEHSCVVYGMPKEAVKAGGVDVSLPLKAIAGKVLSEC